VTDGEGTSVAFLKGNKNGLADLYRQQNSDQRYKFWEETTVDGYPAVFNGVVDNRSSGGCNLAVGVSDPLAVLVQEQLGGQRRKENACDRAKQVAAALITTLKRGG